MSELFEQIKGIVDVQNQSLMNGLVLGRNESDARIKHLENVNAKLLEACKEARNFISGLQIDITREDTCANECQTLLEQVIAEAEGQ